VLLAVDDDADVLRAVEHDLRRRYSGDKHRCRVMSAESGADALSILGTLSERNESVAMFVVDYRMPQMNGIDFLMSAIREFPDAKRVLLTAYADTDAAIRAINQVKLDHYLLKPWDPPDRQLYPVLDDLLADWREHHRPAFDGIRVVGTRWSPRCYELREFLARHHVPFLWLDIEAQDSKPELDKILAKHSCEPSMLPLAILPDGTSLPAAAPGALAERIGLRTRSETKYFDLAIVGGGPAGLAAAVYGASEGVNSVIVEREAPGGQAGMSSRIENYLGFPSGVSGEDLTRRAVTQAKRFGAEILAPQEVMSARADGHYRILTLSDGSELSCRTLIISTGVQWRRLNVPGIENLQGAGVYYGAGATEALSCRDEIVYIVGGANSAGQAAINFAQYAQKVVMLIRGESLAATMSHYLINDVAKTPKIQIEYQTQVVAVHGEEKLEEISISCGRSGRVDKVKASALFVFIGAQPRTDWLQGFVERDDHGFILTGPDLPRENVKPKNWPLDRDPFLLETSVPGVFAVGDVRHGSVKRVASSVGEGAIAVQFIHRYLANT
jgi:thioredoxin reductase (NADPH)